MYSRSLKLCTIVSGNLQVQSHQVLKEQEPGRALLSFAEPLSGADGAKETSRVKGLGDRRKRNLTCGDWARGRRWLGGRALVGEVDRRLWSERGSTEFSNLFGHEPFNTPSLQRSQGLGVLQKHTLETAQTMSSWGWYLFELYLQSTQILHTDMMTDRMVVRREVG